MCEAISSLQSQGLGTSLYLWVPQTCPWTQFPGNSLILFWKVKKGSYYLTQSVEETLGDDGKKKKKCPGRMSWEQTSRPKFVCIATFIFLGVCLCVRVYAPLCKWTCVCVCVHACVSVCMHPSLCEPLTVRKGRMQFTFLCTCRGAATNKKPCA